MNNELGERIADVITKNMEGLDYLELADQILALLPPRLSEEEILSEINKYGYWKNGVEWDFWKRGIAHALAGRIEKPIIEEKECLCGAVASDYCPIHKPKHSEHTKIEEIKQTYALSNCIDQFRFDLSALRDKINELIQDREKLWEAIEKLRKE